MLSENTYSRYYGGDFVTVPSFDNIIKSLTVRYKDTLSNVKSLEEEVAKYKDEHFKDTELGKLLEERNKYRKLYYQSFYLTDEEKEKIKQWMKIHSNTDKEHIHDESYVFTPTPLGTIGKVKCTCGKEFEFRELG